MEHYGFTRGVCTGFNVLTGHQHVTADRPWARDYISILRSKGTVLRCVLTRFFTVRVQLSHFLTHRLEYAMSLS